MSREKQAQALAQPPGPRCASVEIWQKVGTGYCLDELASPRSQTAVLHSRFWKTQVGQKRVQKLRLINGPISFSSSSCFSNRLLPAETNPIYYRPKISLLIANSFRNKFAFTWKLFSLISFFSLLFSFSLPFSALLKHRIVVINLDSGIYLVEMIVNSVNCKFFLHYVNLRNGLDFNPSFLFCKMGMLVTRTAHGDKMNIKMTGTGPCT